MSQGSVATVLRWGGQKIYSHVTFLHDVAWQQFLKSASVSRSYAKNNTDSFLRHGVYIGHGTTRNTLDCNQSSVYSSCVVFSAISQDLLFRSLSLYRRSDSEPPLW